MRRSVILSSSSQMAQSPNNREELFLIKRETGVVILQLVSPDGTNKLGMERIRALHSVIEELRAEAESGQIKA